ncbi:hypothetical protein D3C81_1722040 [compost metagenome]
MLVVNSRLSPSYISYVRIPIPSSERSKLTSTVFCRLSPGTFLAFRFWGVVGGFTSCERSRFSAIHCSVTLVMVSALSMKSTMTTLAVCLPFLNVSVRIGWLALKYMGPFLLRAAALNTQCFSLGGESIVLMTVSVTDCSSSMAFHTCLNEDHR